MNSLEDLAEKPSHSRKSLRHVAAGGICELKRWALHIFILT